MCSSAAISATAWKSLPDFHRPIGSSIIRRRRLRQAIRFASPPQRRRPPRPHHPQQRPDNEARAMQVCANLPPAGRDLRLDLFRGLANWAIFLDHIPHEVLSSFTTRNYGFSDAADLFVFISGYTAAMVFGKVMIERGYLAAALKLARRAFQLYAAHMAVVAVYIALGGAEAIQSVIRTRTVFWLAIAYLAFACVVTMAIQTPDPGSLLPHWMLAPFDPNDKTNLAPYRVAHLIALAIVVTRFLRLDSPMLQWRPLAPLIVCGRNSLQVFCVGIVLSFCAHAAIELSLNALVVQVSVGAAG